MGGDLARRHSGSVSSIEKILNEPCMRGAFYLYVVCNPQVLNKTREYYFCSRATKFFMMFLVLINSVVLKSLLLDM
jgi:hypothetical protein